MKKNRIQKITAQVKRNTKNAVKAKKRIKSRIKHTPEYVTTWEPGPSKSIKYDKDGKVIGFVKWCDKKQTDYTTDIAKAAMVENKSIKNNKKELIKNILKKAGYDPTIKYTRKEKKRFTRAVKNNLFIKPNPVMKTTEQIKEQIKANKAAKKITNKVEMKAKFDESIRNNPLPPKKGKQTAPPAAELSVKEKPNKRRFEYKINRKRSDDPMRVYDFKTDYFDAVTKEDALHKACEIAKEYKNDSSFAGISVKDINGDNSITYYSGKKLLAA